LIFRRLDGLYGKFKLDSHQGRPSTRAPRGRPRRQAFSQDPSKGNQVDFIYSTHGNSTDTTPQQAAPHNRCLPSPAVSTPGLFALLCRWAQAPPHSGGSKDEQSRTAAKTMISFTTSFLKPEPQKTVSVEPTNDRGAKWPRPNDVCTPYPQLTIKPNLTVDVSELKMRGDKIAPWKGTVVPDWWKVLKKVGIDANNCVPLAGPPSAPPAPPERKGPASQLARPKQYLNGETMDAAERELMMGAIDHMTSDPANTKAAHSAILKGVGERETKGDEDKFTANCTLQNLGSEFRGGALAEISDFTPQDWGAPTRKNAEGTRTLATAATQRDLTKRTGKRRDRGPAPRPTKQRIDDCFNRLTRTRALSGFDPSDALINYAKTGSFNIKADTATSPISAIVHSPTGDTIDPDTQIFKIPASCKIVDNHADGLAHFFHPAMLAVMIKPFFSETQTGPFKIKTEYEKNAHKDEWADMLFTMHEQWVASQTATTTQATTATTEAIAAEIHSAQNTRRAEQIKKAKTPRRRRGRRLRPRVSGALVTQPGRPVPCETIQ
jgi:hypothetical protein